MDKMEWEWVCGPAKRPRKAKPNTPREKESIAKQLQAEAQWAVVNERDRLIALLRECREWLECEPWPPDEYQDFRRRLDEALK